MSGRLTKEKKAITRNLIIHSSTQCIRQREPRTVSRKGISKRVFATSIFRMQSRGVVRLFPPLFLLQAACCAPPGRLSPCFCVPYFCVSVAPWDVFVCGCAKTGSLSCVSDLKFPRRIQDLEQRNEAPNMSCRGVQVWCLISM